MDPGGHDDVRFRFLEEPEPPREPRWRKHRRKAATGAATVLLVGAFAAGASALAGPDGTAAKDRSGAAKAAQTQRGAGFHKRGIHCHEGDGAARFGGSSSASQL